MIDVGLVNRDNVFEWVEELYIARSIEVPLASIKVDPARDPMRSDPRFADPRRGMKLQQWSVASTSPHSVLRMYLYFLCYIDRATRLIFPSAVTLKVADSHIPRSRASSTGRCNNI